MTSLMLAIAAAIGVSLGLLGAGGAIVAVPAFVYIGGIAPELADGYALFIVAVSSAIAVGMQWRQRLVAWRTIAWFGPSTILSLIAVRGYLDQFVPQRVQMIFFGIILLVAAVAMMRQRKATSPETRAPHRLRLSAFGIVIGAVGGLLGVGGGFLITPALAVWARLDMKRAVASSLVLICVNSFTGVMVDMADGMQYDWSYVLTFAALTSAGIIGGTLLSRRIDNAALRAAFGWVVLTIGCVVLGIELFA